MHTTRVFTLVPDLISALNIAIRKPIFSQQDSGALLTVGPEGIDVVQYSNGWNITSRSVCIERNGAVRILGQNPTQHEHVDPQTIQRIIDILLGGGEFITRILKSPTAQSGMAVFN